MIITSTQNRVTTGKLLALGVLLAALVAIMLLAAKPAHAETTFTVNSTEDNSDALLTGGVCDTGHKVPGAGGAMDAECTLRAAIQQANYTPGADTIEFAIPGTGVATIAPSSQLPTITKPVSINGYSQPGAQPNTKSVGSDAALEIMLSGAKTVGADGLVIGASNSTVKGLVINQWQGVGIRILGSEASGNRITGNFIGTDAQGGGAYQGNTRGVYVPEGSNNVVGGATPAARNVISNNLENGIFIDLDATGTGVVGNYIGTDATGTQNLGNAFSGVNIEGSLDTTIGGTTAGERNVISGNGRDGISVFATGVRVTGNYIGTDATGTKDLGNTDYGVSINGGENNTVGGAASGARNVISGNGDSGVLLKGTGTRVLGNFIGTDTSGTQDLGNAYSGVTILGSPGNTVGSTTAGARNVISGNDLYGVYVVGSNSTGNRVRGNYIGTDRNGTASLGNSSDGVYILGAPNNAVGGATVGARNVISANNAGVTIDGTSADGNEVVGNYVGTDAGGTRDLGNGIGVYVSLASDTVVGGTTAAERNVISGNVYGVFIEGSSATDNKITGNYIGTDKSGAAPLGNSRDGVLIRSPNNIVGGTQADARNVISGNEGTGVLIEGNSATGNRVLSNSIFANGLLGIDLFAGTLGPTANDPGDTDTGPNNLQNKPVLTSAKKGSTSTRISGTLDSTPNITFKVQFFANAEGADEGKTLLGSTTFSTDLAGKASFVFTTKKEIKVGQSITATATGPFGTSEFSAPKGVVRR